jgi:hypothetical protein
LLVMGAQRLPVSVVLARLVPAACSGRRPRAARDLMLICFYAHHD